MTLRICDIFDGSARSVSFSMKLRIVQVQEDMQKEIDKQVELLRRSTKECDDLLRLRTCLVSTRERGVKNSLTHWFDDKSNNIITTRS